MIETALRARDVMATAVRTLQADMRLSAANRELLSTGIWGAPVLDTHGRVVGVISLSDIAHAVAAGPLRWGHGSFYGELPSEAIHELASRGALSDVSEESARRLGATRVSDAMHRTLHAASPDTSLKEVAQILLDHKIHRLLVLDAGKLVGVVSSQDFVRLFVQG